MAELDDLYNTRILELAAAITRNGRLQVPDASATAHSKLCGSTVTVDLIVRDAPYQEPVRAGHSGHEVME